MRIASDAEILDQLVLSRARQVRSTVCLYEGNGRKNAYVVVRIRDNAPIAFGPDKMGALKMRDTFISLGVHCKVRVTSPENGFWTEQGFNSYRHKNAAA